MRSPCGRALCRLVSLLFLAAPVGCVSEHDAVEKQLSKLRQQVTELQSETDRMAERLDAMEARSASRPEASQAARTAAPETLTRPTLKVVRVEPPEAGEGAEADAADADQDPGPRVVIQGEGKDLETKTLPPLAKPRPEPTRPTKN